MLKEYWWIIARDELGKPYLVFGSDRNEEEARQKGLEVLNGMDFEIRRYPTKDLSTASAYFRGKRLEKGEGLTKATQRIGHHKSIKRYLHRRSNTGI